MRWFELMIVPIALVGSGVAIAASPATEPMDATVDWLMHQSTTAPAIAASTEPAAATQPATPFKSPEEDSAQLGVITMSDGTIIRGSVATTEEKPVRIWDEQQKEYQDVPFGMIRTIEAEVLWERDEKEWRFKASGSDVKEFSGKTYPARETKYKFTLAGGQIVEGNVVAPLYVTTADGKNMTLVLHKRDKGQAGQTLGQLVFVKSFRVGS